MQAKLEGPMGMAIIAVAIIVIGLLGYFVMARSQGASPGDLAIAAQQQAARDGSGAQRGDTTSSAEGRR